MSEKILNIASGKILPLEIRDPYFLINVDTMFYSNTRPENVETSALTWERNNFKSSQLHNINSDIFQFMERTVLTFDRICIYRFLEHVSFTQILYFIYLVSTVTKSGSIVDVIVPNYEILANMIFDENPYDLNFEAANILLTTELLNEPSCPHASIWTPSRAKYFWELEGRFSVDVKHEAFNFDGRNLYLRFEATRI